MFSLVFAYSVGLCFANSEEVKGQNKDFTVIAKAVNNNSGATIGFCIKITNLHINKNLVIVTIGDIREHLMVELFNEQGYNVSKLLKAIRVSRGRNIFKNYEIPSNKSGIWFISVPGEIRINPSKGNEENLQPTPKGRYSALIKVAFRYFTYSKDNMKTLKSPQYKNVFLKLPQIPIKVDEIVSPEEVEKIYNKKSRFIIYTTTN